MLVLSALCGVHGKLVQVNWTSSGVADYRDPSNPLRTELSDMLELDCQDINSNLFIQTEQVQYDQCNASAGSGIYDYNGFCTPGVPLMIALTENSQILMNTVNFENNHLYYFASYSTGQLGDAANEAINSGGQCLDGLKMVLQIGEIPPAKDYIITTQMSGKDKELASGSAACMAPILISLLFVCS